MIRKILTVGLAAAVYSAGYWHGLSSAAAEYETKSAQELIIFIEKLKRAEETAQSISLKYDEQNNQIDELYERNRVLAERLQQSDSANKTGTCNSACRPVKPAPCNTLSGRALQDLVRLAKQADEAGNYAARCHEWAVQVSEMK